MARKLSAGPRISAKALIPLVMMYINFKIDYKSEQTLKVVRFLFFTSLTFVRSRLCGALHAARAAHRRRRA